MKRTEIVLLFVKYSPFQTDIIIEEKIFEKDLVNNNKFEDLVSGVCLSV